MKKIITWFTIIIFGLQGFVVPESFAQGTKPIRENSFYQNFPSHMGQVVSSYKNQISPKVILIQDAHGNFSAQQHIFQLMHWLKQKENYQHFALEGGVGSLDFSPLQAFPSNSMKIAVGEVFMKRGRLSGAELFAMSRGQGAEFYGLEKKDIYDANRKAFLDTLEQEEEMQEYLEEEVRSLSKRKKQVFSPQLLEFESVFSGFEQDQTSAYAFFSSILSKYEESLKNSPLLQKLLILMKQENEDEESMEYFLEEYPVREVFSELRQLKKQLEGKLIQTSKEKELYQQLQRQFLLQKTSQLKLTPEDWSNLQDLMAKFPFTKAEQHLFKAPFLFYEMALLRDEILISNIRNIQRGIVSGLAVLTGGFHTSSISQSLEGRGVSHAVIVPKINQLEEKPVYFDVIQHRHGPLGQWLQSTESFKNPSPSFQKKFQWALKQAEAITHHKGDVEINRKSFNTKNENTRTEFFVQRTQTASSDKSLKDLKNYLLKTKLYDRLVKSVEVNQYVFFQETMKQLIERQHDIGKALKTLNQRIPLKLRPRLKTFLLLLAEDEQWYFHDVWRQHVRDWFNQSFYRDWGWYLKGYGDLLLSPSEEELPQLMHKAQRHWNQKSIKRIKQKLINHWKQLKPLLKEYSPETKRKNFKAWTRLGMSFREEATPSFSYKTMSDDLPSITDSVTQTVLMTSFTLGAMAEGQTVETLTQEIPYTYQVLQSQRQTVTAQSLGFRQTFLPYLERAQGFFKDQLSSTAVQFRLQGLYNQAPDTLSAYLDSLFPEPIPESELDRLVASHPNSDFVVVPPGGGEKKKVEERGEKRDLIPITVEEEEEEKDMTYDEQLEKIVNFLRGRGIDYLERVGVDHENKRIHVLDLSGLSIRESDLRELRGLTLVEELNLRKSNFSNVAFLEAWTGLKKLNLLGAPITDLTPLKNLPNLNNLVLYLTETSNPLGLSELTQLKVLTFGVQYQFDPKQLESLVNLKELYLGSEKTMENLNFVQGMKNLKRIDVKVAEDVDLRPLYRLKGLEVVQIKFDGYSTLLRQKVWNLLRQNANREKLRVEVTQMPGKAFVGWEDVPALSKKEEWDQITKFYEDNETSLNAVDGDPGWNIKLRIESITNIRDLVAIRDISKLNLRGSSISDEDVYEFFTAHPDREDMTVIMPDATELTWDQIKVYVDDDIQKSVDDQRTQIYANAYELFKGHPNRNQVTLVYNIYKAGGGTIRWKDIRKPEDRTFQEEGEDLEEFLTTKIPQTQWGEVHQGVVLESDIKRPSLQAYGLILSRTDIKFEIKNLSGDNQFPTVLSISAYGNKQFLSLEGVEQFPNLEQVYLDNSGIMDLEPLKQAKKLTYLSLKDLTISVEEIDAFFKNHPKRDKLTVFYPDGTSKTWKDVEKEKPKKSTEPKKRWTLSDIAKEPRALTFDEQIELAKKIEVKYPGSPKERISGVSKAKGVIGRLDLGYSSITDEGLSELLLLSSLQELDLINTKLSMDAIYAFVMKHPNRDNLKVYVPGGSPWNWQRFQIAKVASVFAPDKITAAETVIGDSGVESFDLKGKNLSDEQIAAFAQFPELVTIDLTAATYKREAVYELFRNHPNRENLSVRLNMKHSMDWSQAQQQLIKQYMLAQGYDTNEFGLRVNAFGKDITDYSLNLNATSEQDVKVEDIEGLRGLSNITELYLSDSRVIPTDVFTSLPNLVRVSLRGSPLDNLENVLELFVKHPNRENLVVLYGSNQQMTWAEAKVILEARATEDGAEKIIQKPKKLWALSDIPKEPKPLTFQEQVDLAKSISRKYNDGNEGLATGFVFVEQAQIIDLIDLADSSTVTNETLDELLPITGLKNLDLSGTNVTEQAIYDFFLQHPNRSNLNVIDSEGNSSDWRLMQLTKVSSVFLAPNTASVNIQKTITEMLFEGKTLTDEQVAALSQFPDLTEIDLTGANYNIDAVYELFRNHPNRENLIVKGLPFDAQITPTMMGLDWEAKEFNWMGAQIALVRKLLVAQGNDPIMTTSHLRVPKDGSKGLYFLLGKPGNLGGEAINDIEGFRGLTHIRVLDLVFQDVANIRVLSTLTNLETLDISRTPAGEDEENILELFVKHPNRENLTVNYGFGQQMDWPKAKAILEARDLDDTFPKASSVFSTVQDATPVGPGTVIDISLSRRTEDPGSASLFSGAPLVSNDFHSAADSLLSTPPLGAGEGTQKPSSSSYHGIPLDRLQYWNSIGVTRISNTATSVRVDYIISPGGDVETQIFSNTSGIPTEVPLISGPLGVLLTPADVKLIAASPVKAIEFTNAFAALKFLGGKRQTVNLVSGAVLPDFVPEADDLDDLFLDDDEEPEDVPDEWFIDDGESLELQLKKVREFYIHYDEFPGDRIHVSDDGRIEIDMTDIIGVIDLEPLRGLTLIESLKLNTTVLSNMEVLSSLTGLRFVRLSQSNITDLSPLYNLPELTGVNVGSTGIGKEAIYNLFMANPNREKLEVVDKNGLEINWLFVQMSKIQSLFPGAEVSPHKGSEISVVLQEGTVADEQLASLARFSSLTFINLEQAQVNANALVELFRNHPNREKLVVHYSDNDPMTWERAQQILDEQELETTFPVITPQPDPDMNPGIVTTGLPPLGSAGLETVFLKASDFSGEGKELSFEEQVEQAKTFLKVQGVKEDNLGIIDGEQKGIKLTLYQTPVSDISALSKLTSLQSLDLDGSPVSDISALSNLLRLQKLSLGNTKVSDISALSKLTSLQSLSLTWTNISNISTLSNLPRLQSLYLIGTNVYELSALSNLTRLQRLDLSGTDVSNKSIYEFFVTNENRENLEVRNKEGGKITWSDVPEEYKQQVQPAEPFVPEFIPVQKPLSFDEQVERVRAFLKESNSDQDSINITGEGEARRIELVLPEGTSLIDISVLSGITYLTILNLSGTDVKDISALNGLTNLVDLDLMETSVSNEAIYELFVKNENRKNLMVWGSDTKLITWADVPEAYKQLVATVTVDGDISALTSLTNLKHLNLEDGQQAKELSFEEQVARVKAFLAVNGLDDKLMKIEGEGKNQTIALNLKSRSVGDLNGLNNLTSLEDLDLGTSTISNISSLSNLASLTGLKELNLNGVKVYDINILSDLTSLERLYLGHHNVSDLSALSGLINLKMFSLGKTDTKDISSLSKWKSLEGVSLAGSLVSDVRALNSLTSLHTLNLVDTNVSDESIYELFVANPNRENLKVWKTVKNAITWWDVPEEYKQQVKPAETFVPEFIPVQKPLSFEEQVERVKEFLAKNAIGPDEELYGTKRLTIYGEVGEKGMQLFLSDTSVKSLSGLEGLTFLHEIHLLNTSISDLSSLISMPNLTWIDLREIEFNNEAIYELFVLHPNREKLTVVDMNEDGITWADVPEAYKQQIQSEKLSFEEQVKRVKSFLAENGLSEDKMEIEGEGGNRKIQLTLINTEVSDVSSLSGLTSLRNLELGRTDVSDVSSLSGLTSLETLDLRETEVSDVSSLSGLTSLMRLDLEGTQVSDVSIYELFVTNENRENLKVLNKEEKEITWADVPEEYKQQVQPAEPFVPEFIPVQKPLSFDEQVARVKAFLAGNGLSEDKLVIEGEGGNRKMQLTLINTEVSDVSSLSGLTSLKMLDLRETPVSDVSSLSGLTSLKMLYLSGTQVSDVSSLSGLTSLKKLYLRETPVSDVSNLSGLTSLERLDLYGTQVSDVSSLSGLTSLKTLNLEDTQVSDVSIYKFFVKNENRENLEVRNKKGMKITWADVPEAYKQQIQSEKLSFEEQVERVKAFLAENKIEEKRMKIIGEGEGRRIKLDLTSTNITNVINLNGLPNLEELILNNTRVSDINILDNLPNLKTLGYEGVRVEAKEVISLSALTGLESLYLGSSFGKVSDIKSLAGLKKLRNVGLRGTKVSDESIYELFVANENREELTVTNKDGKKITWAEVPEEYKQQEVPVEKPVKELDFFGIPLTKIKEWKDKHIESITISHKEQRVGVSYLEDGTNERGESYSFSEEVSLIELEDPLLTPEERQLLIASGIVSINMTNVSGIVDIKTTGIGIGKASFPFSIMELWIEEQQQAQTGLVGRETSSVSSTPDILSTLQTGLTSFSMQFAALDDLMAAQGLLDSDILTEDKVSQQLSLNFSGAVIPKQLIPQLRNYPALARVNLEGAQVSDLTPKELGVLLSEDALTWIQFSGDTSPEGLKILREQILIAASSLGEQSSDFPIGTRIFRRSAGLQLLFKSAKANDYQQYFQKLIELLARTNKEAPFISNMLLRDARFLDLIKDMRLKSDFPPGTFPLVLAFIEALLEYDFSKDTDVVLLSLQEYAGEFFKLKKGQTLSLTPRNYIEAISDKIHTPFEDAGIDYAEMELPELYELVLRDPYQVKTRVSEMIQQVKGVAQHLSTGQLYDIGVMGPEAIKAYVTALPDVRNLDRAKQKLAFYYHRFGAKDLKVMIKEFGLSEVLSSTDASIRRTVKMFQSENLEDDDEAFIEMNMTEDEANALAEKFGTIQVEVGKKHYHITTVDNPKAAWATEEQIEKVERYDLWDDLNYKALQIISREKKTVADYKELKEVLEQFVLLYLELFRAGPPTDLAGYLSRPHASNDYQQGWFEAELTRRTFEIMDQKLKEQFGVDNIDELPDNKRLRKQFSKTINRYNATVASRYIGTGAENWPSFWGNADYLETSLGELINVIHQRGIKKSSGVFSGETRSVMRTLSYSEGAAAFETGKYQPKYLDLRRDRDVSEVPMAARMLAEAFGPSENVNTFRLTDKKTPNIFASEHKAKIWMGLGAHSARATFNIAPHEMGGRSEIEYEDSGASYKGSKYRARIIAAALKKLGFIVKTPNDYVVHAILDKDHQASSFREIQTATRSALNILANALDMDYWLGHFLTYYSGSQSKMDKLVEALADHYARMATIRGEMSLKKIGGNEYPSPFTADTIFWDGEGDYEDDFTRVMGAIEGDVREALAEKAKIKQLPTDDVGQVFFDKRMDMEVEAIHTGKVKVDASGNIQENTKYKEKKQAPAEYFIKYLAENEDWTEAQRIGQLANEFQGLAIEKKVVGEVGVYRVEQLVFPFAHHDFSLIVLTDRATGKMELGFALWGQDVVEDVPFLDRIRHRVIKKRTVHELKETLEIFYLNGYKSKVKPEGFMKREDVLSKLKQKFFVREEVSDVQIRGVITSRGFVSAKMIPRKEDGQTPEDYLQGVFTSRTAEVDDDPFIEASLAIVTTTGGTLSHQAIRAREFGIPGLIIKSADFKDGKLVFKVKKARIDEGFLVLRIGEEEINFTTKSYDEEEIFEIKEGDIITIDGHRGILHWIAPAEDKVAQTILEISLRIKANKEKIEDEATKAAMDRDVLALFRMTSALKEPNQLKFLLQEALISLDLTATEKSKIIQTALEHETLHYVANNFLLSLVNSMTTETQKFMEDVLVKITETDDLRQAFYYVEEAKQRIGLVTQLIEQLGEKGLRVPKVSFRSAFHGLLVETGVLKDKELRVLNGELSDLMSHELKMKEKSLYELRKLMLQMQFLSRGMDHLDEEYEELMGINDVYFKNYSDLFEYYKDLRRQKIAQASAEKKDPDKKIISVSEVDYFSRSIAGGKGSNTGEITKIVEKMFTPKIKAPPGLVVTTQLYDSAEEVVKKFPKQDKSLVMERLLLLLKVDLVKVVKLVEEDPNTEQNIKDLLYDVFTEFQEDLIEDQNDGDGLTLRDLDRNIRNMKRGIRKIMKGLGEEEFSDVLGAALRAFAGYAFRSSGVKEDSELDSFAGQKTTVANVVGVRRGIAAIESVWASGAEAVLVQPMIAAVKAGIAFSADMATGDLSRIRINSVWGLGEGAVSGLVDPDQILMEKESLIILSQTPGEKKTQVVLKDEDVKEGQEFTKEVDTPLAKRTLLSLTKDETKLIAKAIKALEAHYGYPVDMEWAFDPYGNLIILQVRAITTLNQEIQKGKEIFFNEVNESDKEYKFRKRLAELVRLVNNHHQLVREHKAKNMWMPKDYYLPGETPVPATEENWGERDDFGSQESVLKGLNKELFGEQGEFDDSTQYQWINLSPETPVVNNDLLLRVGKIKYVVKNYNPTTRFVQAANLLNPFSTLNFSMDDPPEDVQILVMKNGTAFASSLGKSEMVSFLLGRPDMDLNVTAESLGRRMEAMGISPAIDEWEADLKLLITRLDQVFSFPEQQFFGGIEKLQMELAVYQNREGLDQEVYEGTLAVHNNNRYQSLIYYVPDLVGMGTEDFKKAEEQLKNMLETYGKKRIHFVVRDEVNRLLLQSRFTSEIGLNRMQVSVLDSVAETQQLNRLIKSELSRLPQQAGAVLSDIAVMGNFNWLSSVRQQVSDEVLLIADDALVEKGAYQDGVDINPAILIQAAFERLAPEAITDAVKWSQSQNITLFRKIYISNLMHQIDLWSNSMKASLLILAAA